MKILRAGKKEKEIIKAIDLYEIFQGDILYTKCYGGGGWGYPLNRDPDKVKFNAMEGLVTFDRARGIYGVVLTQTDKDNPETINVDYEATKRLREKMQSPKTET